MFKRLIRCCDTTAAVLVMRQRGLNVWESLNIEQLHLEKSDSHGELGGRCAKVGGGVDRVTVK